MALTPDASTPSSWGQSAAAGGSGSSGSFSPPANAFILLCVGIGGDQVVNTVTNTGTAQTWTRYTKDVGAAAGNNDLELWYANTGGTAPGAINVTVSQTAGTHGGTAGMYVSVLPIVFAGAETTPGGATAGLNSATLYTSTLTVTTTRAGSYVLGIGFDGNLNTARTVGPGQTMIADQGDLVGDEVWAQRTTSPVSASGTATTVNDTAPTQAGMFRAIEIRAASTAPAATGGLTFGGTANPRATATMTGGLSFGGTTTPRVATATAGGLTFTGSATPAGRATATGSLAFGGAATPLPVGTAATSIGGLTFSGSVGPAQFTATGGLTFSGAVTPNLSSAAGGLTFGGAATSSTAVSAAGGLAFGGVGTPAALAAAGGSITFSGAAAVYQTPLTSHGDGRVTFVTTGAASSTTANPAAATATVTTQNAATAAVNNLDAWGAITV